DLDFIGAAANGGLRQDHIERGVFLPGLLNGSEGTTSPAPEGRDPQRRGKIEGDNARAIKLGSNPERRDGCARSGGVDFGLALVRLRRGHALFFAGRGGAVF